jgi:hypothetical protein
MNVFIKKRLIHGKNLYANYKQKHTVKLYKLTYIRITKTKHLSSTKSIQLDPWISEPRLTEKLLHLEVNLGYIISWKKKIS